MDPIGTTKEAVDFLVEAIKFIRAYKDVPNDIKHSLDRSLQSSENLKMWMDAFGRLDQKSIPEQYIENLMMKLHHLKDALDSHRRQIEGWMDMMGLPREKFKPEHTKDSGNVPGSVFSPNPVSRKSSLKLKDFIAPIRRSIYVLNGANTVKSIEKKVKEAESDVMNVYLTIFPFAELKSFRHDSGSATNSEPPLARFLRAAKKRREDRVPVNIISNDEWTTLYKREEVDVDENIVPDYPLRFCHISPQQGGEEIDPATRGGSSKTLVGNFICYSRSNDADEKESMNLARLFAEDEESQSDLHGFGTFREDGDMLRLSAVVRTETALQYVFRVPQWTTKVRTLRSLLLDADGAPDGRPVPLHPISERAKFAIRLATSVLVVHSLDLVHKRIYPDSIIVIDAEGTKEFPYSLGYPYLVGFHLTRSQNAKTSLLTDHQALAKRGIYSHPRDQVERRTEKISMISDIYSLGVCLFEVALWRSLFIKDPEGKSTKDYVPDKSSDFAKLADSYYGSIPMPKKAKAKTEELIRIAKEEIPKTMGDKFADVVVACLRAGYPDSPFADQDDLITEEESQPNDKTISPHNSKNISVKYLELVLKKLQEVHEGLSSMR